MSVRAFITLAALFGSLHGQVPEHLKSSRIIDFAAPEGLGYTQHGYRITGPEGQFLSVGPWHGISANNGTTALRISKGGNPVTLTHADGLAFDLLALDLAEYSTVAVPDRVRIRGHRADGSVLNHVVVPDGIIDGDGPLVDYEHIILPSEWTDLLRVEILDNAVTLDNIEVRGLGMDGFDAGDLPTPPLEMLATLETTPSYNSWGVEAELAGDLVLWRQRYSRDPVYRFRFDLETREIITSMVRSDTSGGNLVTGERASVSGGVLRWFAPDGTSAERARLGEDGVNGISFPRPADGKVLFVNHWYQGEERYAVFLAGPDGVHPVLTPDMVLPDGGHPHSFPYELHFNGQSFAIPTSTSESAALFIMSFDGGPLLLGPGQGTVVPGTTAILKQRPELQWLAHDSAGFLGTSTEGELMSLVMTADGTITGSALAVPGNSALVLIPASGYLLRHQASARSGKDGTLLSYGPLVCHDLAPNDRFGITVLTPEGTRHIMIREGQEVEGFGLIDRLYFKALVHDGWFYATARNVAGTWALLRARIPRREPRLRAGKIIQRTNGTVRLMVEHLTHGLSYRVEAMEDLGGEWLTLARFKAGAPRRSVHCQFTRGTGGFFRVREDE